ncbi:sugar phosphate isomerase/epimerase family protein [Alkalicoccobacillus porphyridii]|uniref:Sugar phosphate isomerase/epimerase n=1 Tax=Alkalicoccobacillus porphyridii TaxID=2597270 RepID=A0A553ZX41_9BACI|nr:sugar phosphate isomerase/epimerase family protein [Alkalicoccobacillus porphyridii]TSB46029.1 sugar phosphate isomerase/epimerase [Alkalicoccobacillus porphyridii]
MKLGMSSYSLVGAINTGELSILDVLQWTADNGGQHVEIVPIGYSLTDQPELIEEIVEKAKELDIELSNYAIGADFLKGDRQEFEQEMARVKQQVDIAHALGVKRMRHDVSFKPPAEATIEQFEADLPRLVEGCQQIADYATQFDIITSIENHGFYVQASDRVKRLIHLVDRPNFRTTLDTGNFLCVDEDPVAAVKNNISVASMVHVKDFYVRRASSYDPGEGWFKTTAGNHLRGAITGHGDIPLQDILNTIKQSGYDGYISIEFEGLEECKKAAKISMDNVRRVWDSL